MLFAYGPSTSAAADFGCGLCGYGFSASGSRCGSDETRLLIQNGEDGFLRLVEAVMRTAVRLRDGINAIDGLRIVSTPEMSVSGQGRSSGARLIGARTATSASPPRNPLGSQGKPPTVRNRDFLESTREWHHPATKCARPWARPCAAPLSRTPPNRPPLEPFRHSQVCILWGCE